MELSFLASKKPLRHALDHASRPSPTKRIRGTVSSGRLHTQMQAFDQSLLLPGPLLSYREARGKPRPLTLQPLRTVKPHLQLAPRPTDHLSSPLTSSGLLRLPKPKRQRSRRGSQPSLQEAAISPGLPPPPSAQPDRPVIKARPCPASQPGTRPLEASAPL